MMQLIEKLIPYLPEIAKWLFLTAIPATVIWTVSLISRRRTRKRNHEAFKDFIVSLPTEAFQVLLQFKEAGTHTIILAPYDPVTLYLVKIGFVTHVGSAGGYAAASGLFMLRADVFREIRNGLAHPSQESRG